MALGWRWSRFSLFRNGRCLIDADPAAVVVVLGGGGWGKRNRFGKEKQPINNGVVSRLVVRPRCVRAR